MIKLTPPMGWNSWNTFGENINEKMIFETADVMAESGLRDKGYEYLVIDDCWSLRERDENGRLVPDPEKFPHGMKAGKNRPGRGEVSQRNEGCQRLCPQQGSQVRYVFLRRKHDVCRLPWQL